MKKDWLIWGIAVLAVIIIITYIIFDLNCNFFQVLLNLSYSYLAATIFYIVQVCMPTRKKEEKALIELQSYIHNIYNKMDFFIKFTGEIFEITNENLNILGDDEGIIYYNLGTNIKQYTNYRQYLRGFEKSIENEINKLRKNELFSYLPNDLLEILSNIEMQEYSNIKSIADLYPICKSYNGLNNELEKIKDNWLKISEYNKKINNNSIKLLNDEDKEEYKRDILKYKSITQLLTNEISKNKS